MSTVHMSAVGDTTPGNPPERTFEFVKSHIERADIRFAQVERLFSERGSYQQLGIAPHVRVDPALASTYGTVPFNVVSVASNHTGDWGPEAVEDTVETFRDLGIKTVGAGRNLAEARRPAVFEKNGVTVGILGYASVLLPQYWATEDRAGAAPMRARSLYEPYEPYQPGSPALPVTVPYSDDLEALVSDIRELRKQVDVVVMSIHWGLHFIPKPVADYQKIVARAAIDAGASAVIGHHPHVLQAVEAYNNGLIMYSLGNFAFYRKEGSPLYCLPKGEFTFEEVYSREYAPDSKYDWNRYWGEGGVLNLELGMSGLVKATFSPTVMNERFQPVLVGSDSERLEYFRNYLLWVSAGHPGGLEDISVDGDDLLLFKA